MRRMLWGLPNGRRAHKHNISILTAIFLLKGIFGIVVAGTCITKH